MLAPGVTLDDNNTPVRLGGGGDPNIMMDGVSAMDTGSNRPLLQMNVESIAEVKVLTSGYQAEYGRSSGVQVTAVTKSGTNRFRGVGLRRRAQLRLVLEQQDQQAQRRTRRRSSKERDWGFSIGGPIGKPGGNNKLFFFYARSSRRARPATTSCASACRPRSSAPGDFSQTTDNNGASYPYIKDPLLTGACTAARPGGCFADGGVLGRIPANRLYQTGPEHPEAVSAAEHRQRPGAARTTTTRSPGRPRACCRGSRRSASTTSRRRSCARAFKYSAWEQRDQIFLGTIPGFNDTQMQTARS